MQPIYIVMFVVLSIWAGLFAYLWRLDSRLKGIEGRIAHAPAEAGVDAPAAVLEAHPDAPAGRAS